MRVKICSKCGAENKDTNASCSSCYASLDGAEVRTVADKTIDLPPPTESAGEQPLTALGGQPMERPAAASPYGPPPGGATAYGPPKFEGSKQVARQGSKAGLVIFLLVVLAGAAAGWWFFLRAPSPGEVVQKFIAASTEGDIEKIKPYLTESTLNMPGFAQGVAMGAKMRKEQGADAKKQNQEVAIISTTFEGDKAIVKCEPKDKSKAMPGMGTQAEIVLVREEGKWKIDLMTTAQRMFAKYMSGKNLKMPQGMRPPGK